MSTVRVLVDYVGSRMAGDVVVDAPAGLVNMALQQAKHAVTGELLVEIVSDFNEPIISEAVTILAELTEKAISHGIDNAETLSITQLISAIAQAEWNLIEASKVEQDNLAKQKADEDLRLELVTLKANAKELKIEGYTKMTADELKVAIAALAGGGADGK